jgi:UDP-N-acetylmuramate dehydrogenase
MILMDIRENVPLSDYSTMRLGGKARYLGEAHTDRDIADLTDWAKQKKTPFIVVGQGSNIVWRDKGFAGLIIVNRLRGREIIDEDDNGATIRLAAGENWDDAVAWTVKRGWGGLEFLSKIPGTVGAAPVQNIGAYGHELSETLVEVEAYDAIQEAFGGIASSACGFGYRTSRFKTADRGRFIITRISLKLGKQHPKPPFYESLQSYFDAHDIEEYTRETVRDAVTAIRAVKLPDPSRVKNNGSFFTNPIIDKSKFERIKHRYPDIKAWVVGDGRVKLSAGWLVERAGFKNVHDKPTGMATWKGSALVVVNENAKKTADLLKFKKKIIEQVQAMFGITLEQEPELLP